MGWGQPPPARGCCVESRVPLLGEAAAAPPCLEEPHSASLPLHPRSLGPRILLQGDVPSAHRREGPEERSPSQGPRSPDFLPEGGGARAWGGTLLFGGPRQVLLSRR